MRKDEAITSRLLTELLALARLGSDLLDTLSMLQLGSDLLNTLSMLQLLLVRPSMPNDPPGAGACIYKFG